MCNLYRLASGATEVARTFAPVARDIRILPGNTAAEVFPGYPALVLAENTLRSMAWGFPLARKGARGQPLKPRPVNNARSDKLGSPFWASSFRDRRCLIPVNSFAEAEGPAGSKTRTWFSLPNQPIMAIAGFWRPTDEWGDACTMLMTSACRHVESVHDRMPVILAAKDWRTFLGPDPQAAWELCLPYAGDMRVDRTAEPWAGRS